MASGMTFTIKSNRFPQAPAAMRRAIGSAFAASRGPILEDMKRRTPVDKGDLRNSEAATSDDNSLTFTAGTDHALVVHQGTYRMGARPFMRDAIEAGIPRIERAIASAADAELG